MLGDKKVLAHVFFQVRKGHKGIVKDKMVFSYTYNTNLFYTKVTTYALLLFSYFMT